MYVDWAKAMVWIHHLQVFRELWMRGNWVVLLVGLSVLENLLKLVLHDWGGGNTLAFISISPQASC